MQIQGTVIKITKKTIQGKVLVYVKAHRRQPIQVLVKKSQIQKNMPFVMEGEFVNNYFVAENTQLIFLDPNTYAKYLSAKATGSGIGLKTIQKFTNKYRELLLTIKKEELREKILSDFTNLNVAKVDLFLDAIYKESTIGLIEDYFEDFNLDYDTLEKIDEEYGADAIKKFKENPYAQCNYFAIKIFIADYLAKREGFEVLDERRLNGFIVNELMQNENNGNTYIDAKDLSKRVLNKINRSPVYKEKVFAIHIANIICTDKRYVFTDDGKIFLKNTYVNEKTVAQRLLALNNMFKSYITVSDDDIKDVEDKLNITLGAEQKRALKMLEQNGVLVLTGGPGVGKTATVNAITTLYKMKVKSGKIKYCAPTGRAAKRLAESVNDEAVTIHKLVELLPFEKTAMAKKCAANPIEADFIIIDETSMVDIEIAAILLSAIKTGTRILFVGDENQLPSVGAGNLLHDIIASGRFDVFRLTKNYRQSEDSSIIDNASLVKEGINPIANDTDFIVKEFYEGVEAKEYLRNVVKDNYDINNPFNMQVIEPTNQECFATNKWTHNNIINDFDDAFVSIGLKDKVMFKVNKYEENEAGQAEILYANGEMGVVTYIDKDEVVVSDGKDEKVLPSDAISDMALSFSCTIHKSQGSENPLIVIYLPSNASNMMTRPLLYTAITRAKEKVIIISVDDALEKCVKTVGEKRKTYLIDLLEEAA